MEALKTMSATKKCLQNGEVLSFRDYMVANHIDRDDPIGDLARDISEDDVFPDEVNIPKETIEEYLEFRSDGWDAVMDAFHRSWQEYEGYKAECK